MPEQVAVLYHHSNGAEAASLENTIEQITNRRLSPSRLLIICGNGRQQQIKSHFDSLDPTVRERVKVAHEIQILPYDYKGAGMMDSAIAVHGDGWPVSEDDLSEYARDGLGDLIEKTDVVIKAPRGYSFRKPSGRAKKTFIRTGNIFREPSSLAVTSHMLLRTLPSEARTLYIDSFTILPAAMDYQKERAEVAAACGVKLSEITIKNFHSYSIDPGLRFPGDDEYSVLISASTSGGLARKLGDEHGCNSRSIYHFLLFGDGEDLRERTVYFRNETSEHAKSFQVFRREIHIPGEEFVAAHSSPRPIKITRRHIDSKEGKVLKAEFYQANLRINLGSIGKSSFSLFSLSEIHTPSHKEFSEWLEDELAHSVPANTGLILAVDDGRSMQLAENAKSILEKLMQREIPVTSVSKLQLGKDLPKIEPKRAVLIVCSDTGLGEELLSASRLLREFPHNHRHYLVGHLFQETAMRLERLKSNLKVSGRPREYGWSQFFGNPIGQIEIHDTWKIESALLNQNLQNELFEKLDKDLRDALTKRSELLNGSCLCGNEIFLPRRNLDPLKLRPESVLHPGNYERIDQITVYLGVSMALQRARDGFDAKGEELEEDMCFTGNPFMPSVLDPDTFSRYNDGVIQAAILRACAPDELNYSNDRVLSRQMSNILIAAIKHSETNSGEATYEMLFAVATKRLRIQDEHYEEMVSAMVNHEVIRSFWAFLKSEQLI